MQESVLDLELALLRMLLRAQLLYSAFHDDIEKG